jgi:CSLREA domain-containing protein
MSKPGWRIGLSTVLAAVSLGVTGVLLPSLTLAASILVNSADDELNSDGDCSLREAVESANTNTIIDNCNPGDSGTDTITILVSGTVALGSALSLTEPVTIQGVATETTTLSGSNADRIFDIDVPATDGEVLIRQLSIENGHTASPSGGGGIIVRCVGTLRLEAVEMRDNSAVGDGGINGAGGAINFRPETGCASGRLEVVDSAFIDNESALSLGGALYVSNSRAPLDAVVIESSLFENNISLEGGAIAAIDIPLLSIEDSRFEGNQIDTVATMGNRHGGALFVRQSSSLPSTPLTLIERTSFLFNYSGEGGGAAHFDGPGAASIRNSFAFNNNIAQVAGGRAFDIESDASLSIFFSSIINNGSGTSNDSALRAGPGASITLDHTIVSTDWATVAHCDTWGDGAIT